MERGGGGGEGRQRERGEENALPFCIYFNNVKSAWIVGQLNKTRCRTLSLSIGAIYTHTQTDEKYTHTHPHSPMHKVNCCVRWECKMNLCQRHRRQRVALVHCSHKLCCHMSDTVRAGITCPLVQFQFQFQLSLSLSQIFRGLSTLETVKCRCAACVGCNLRARNGWHVASRV